MKEEYLTEPLIKEAALSIWTNALALCHQNPEWNEKETYYTQKIQQYSTTDNLTETVDGDYETLIKRQENENVLDFLNK